MYGFCCRSFIGYSRTLCRPVYVYRVLPCKYHAFFSSKDHLIKIVWLADIRSMLNDLSFFLAFVECPFFLSIYLLLCYDGIGRLRMLAVSGDIRETVA